MYNINMNYKKITIFGETYTVRGSVDEEYIFQIGRFVDNRMKDLRQSSPHLDAKKLAVLTAINIADELLQERQNLQEEEEKELSLAVRTTELISLLDEGLIASSPL